MCSRIEKPLSLAWYDLQTGKTRAEAPALLRAFEWLTKPSVRSTNSFTIADQTEISSDFFARRRMKRMPKRIWPASPNILPRFGQQATNSVVW